MSDIDTGGPAFPTTKPLEHWGDPNQGMTLRDYFAAQALGVMCSSNVKATGTFASPDGRATVASVCYLMADAMLEARKGGAS
jgi:hypothetical protein